MKRILLAGLILLAVALLPCHTLAQTGEDVDVPLTYAGDYYLEGLVRLKKPVTR